MRRRSCAAPRPRRLVGAASRAADAAAKNLSQEIRSDSADVRRRVEELLDTVNGWRRTLGLPLLARPEERPPVHYRQRDLQHRDACNELADLDAVREAASELAGAAIQAEQDHRRLVEALTQAREAAAAALWDVERERRAVADRRRLLVAAALTVVLSFGAVIAVDGTGGDMLEALAAPFALGVLVGYSTSTRLGSDVAARLAMAGVLRARADRRPTSPRRRQSRS